MEKRVAKGLDKPWRFDNISEEQFMAQADTGDILLFKGSMPLTALTRTFTNS